MGDTHLSLRCSPWLRDRLDRLAAGRGISRSALVRAAVLEAVESSSPDLPAVPDRAEILRLLSIQVRAAGSVPAARLLLSELQATDPERSRSLIDELANRRKKTP
jgi:hypothetical protein